MKLTSQDQLNIAIQERFLELSTREKYIYNKEIRSAAIMNLAIGTGLALFGLILSSTISRLFYGFLLFGLVGITRGTISLVNPKNALRSRLAEEIKSKDEALTNSIASEQKNKHKVISAIWLSFLGVALLIIFGLLAVVLIAGNR